MQEVLEGIRLGNLDLDVDSQFHHCFLYVFGCQELYAVSGTHQILLLLQHGGLELPL